MAASQSATRSGWGFVNWGLFRHRFVVLLGAVLLLLVMPPVLQATGSVAEPRAARALMAVLLGLTLLAVVFAVSRDSLAQAGAVLLGIPAVILQGMNVVVERQGMMASSHILCLVLLSVAVVILVAYLFTAERINLNTVCAAISAYLLLGLLWAIGYSLLGLLAPGSFSFSAAPGGGAMLFGGGQSATPLYYSFATMTTLGCSDIAPATSTAKMLTTVQAAMGQLYVAVLIARLVGLHVTQTLRKPA